MAENILQMPNFKKITPIVPRYNGSFDFGLIIPLLLRFLQ